MQNQYIKQQKMVAWIRKIGIWGFLFFLVKGLIWLALAWVAVG
jgi:hypothetical protein